MSEFRGFKPAACAILMLALVVPLQVSGQQRSYTLDTDPYRLGGKALERGLLDEAEAHFEEAVANDHKVPESLFGLGGIAAREGRYEDAEYLYRRAMSAKGGGYPEARAGLGLLLLRLGREQEAAQEFTEALKRNAKLWDAHYGQARLLLSQDKWGEALRELDRGESLRGVVAGEDKYRYGMALHQLGRGNVEAAEQSALLALHLNPTDPEYGALVGRIYEMRDAPTLAIDAYNQALNAPGMKPTAPMLHTLGGLYQKVERYNDARDSYMQAVGVDSTYAPALRDLAVLFRLAKRHDQAARTYLRYVVLEREDIDALLGLADSCYEINQFGQSVEAARTALSLDGSREDVRFAFARAGIRSRDPQAKVEASRLMTDLPEILPWRVEDMVALAVFQTERKQYAPARRSLERASALDPQFPAVFFQRGIIDLREGDVAAAVADFGYATTLKPDSPAYFLNLGIAQYQAGRLADAVPSFRRAVALNEDLVSARLLLAQVLAANDELGEAEREYRTVLEREPGNAKAMRGIGFCRIRAADYAGAVTMYRDATRADADNADGWAGLGSAQLGLENLAEAETAFARARSIDASNVMLRKGTELLEQAKAAAGGS